MTDYRRLAIEYDAQDTRRQRVCDGIEAENRAGVSLIVRCANDIEPRQIQWLWKFRLARGRYSELVGFPGIGKTALAMDVIARLTTHGRWPDGSSGPTTQVLIAA